MDQSSGRKYKYVDLSGRFPPPAHPPPANASFLPIVTSYHRRDERENQPRTRRPSSNMGTIFCRNLKMPARASSDVDLEAGGSTQQ